MPDQIAAMRNLAMTWKQQSATSRANGNEFAEFCSARDTCAADLLALAFDLEGQGEAPEIAGLHRKIRYLELTITEEVGHLTSDERAELDRLSEEFV